jgi:cell division protein FtsZ
LITTPGLINLDFADVRSVMNEGGSALMAIGQANGDNRAQTAAEQAIHSALLDISIDGAQGILFNITGGPDLSLHEVNEAAEIIRRTADPDANIIFGAVVDSEMKDGLRITVIATGFDAFKAHAITSHEESKTLEFPRRTFDRDDLDIPAFLRRARH